jgi:hypothetical protein
MGSRRYDQGVASCEDVGTMRIDVDVAFCKIARDASTPIDTIPKRELANIGARQLSLANTLLQHQRAQLLSHLVVVGFIT